MATGAQCEGSGGSVDWVILGLTSGIWAFEATAPDVIPQVVLLPINFTNRKPQSAQGGSFPWDLPLWVRRSTNGSRAGQRLVRVDSAEASHARVRDARHGLGRHDAEQSRPGVEDVVGRHRATNVPPWAQRSKTCNKSPAPSKARFGSRDANLGASNRTAVVAAVQGLEDGRAGDPELLERLRDQATAFALTDGEARTLDLRLDSPQK